MVDPIAEQLIARLRGNPADAEAYERLKTRYREMGDFASLANLLEGWAGNNAEHWEAASDAFVEAADAAMRANGDRERAVGLYQQALQLNLTHSVAADALRALLAESAQYQQLAEFLDFYARSLEQAGAERARVAALYRELATLWDEQFGRSETAAAYRQHADSLGPNGHSPAVAVAVAAAEGEEDASALADDYEQAAEAEQDPAAKTAILCDLARVKAERLNDLEGGVLALRQALSISPGDILVMHQLATLLLARAQSGDAEQAATDQRRVAELFYQIAQGVEGEQAIEYLTSALEAAPDHDGALALLERVAPRYGRGDLLAGYWVGYVAAAAEGPETDQRRLYLGQAYLEAGQLEDALYCLSPVAEQGNDRANELLQQIYALEAQGARAGGPQEGGQGAFHAGHGHLPAQRTAPRARDEEIAQQVSQVSQLRRRVHELVAARQHEEAAALCREILAIDPNDPEAFNLLESHYRKRRDYNQLRDLLLASTRVPGLSVDARKLRLREVATLSETKLRDADAAISAWRGVVTLDPADRDATRSLKRLLKKAQHWDELAGVLEREALATTAPEEKADLIREIALIHRDKRKDKGEAAEAFRQLHALRPDDVALRDEFFKLCLELELWEDAAPLLRTKLEQTSDTREQYRLAAQLAEILHEKLADLDGAYAACEQMLALKEHDRAAFDRMERIDDESANHERRLATLERRVEATPRAERPALLVRMATLADQQAGNLDKAAEYLGDALDLAPDDQEALARLTEMFERAGRYADLVELLRERTLLEQDEQARAALYKRIAATLAEYLDDEQGAGEAYRRLLDVNEDEEALRFLRTLAARDDDAETLADVQRRLAALVADADERRDLTYDLGVTLSERLDRPKDAIATFRRLLEALDPTFGPAIDELEMLCERHEDMDGLALALERRIATSDAPQERLPHAKRLADLCQHKLEQPARAISALLQWAGDAEVDPEPHRRLVGLLPAQNRHAELLASLDALAAWEDDFDARDKATLDGAVIAFERLNDAEGAWKRLEPLVEAGHEEAERVLRDIATRAGRAPLLAGLYVRLAQDSEDAELVGDYWRRAAEVYDTMLGQNAQALEAALRMLAADLDNRVYLAEVDRLAVKAKAWQRLAQVYDRLLKRTEEDEEKIALLTRHAALLEAAQPEDALDRLLRACALSPDDTALLEHAETLAHRTDRSEELLVVYDRRIARAERAEDRVNAALRAARLCDAALRDRERANQYLKTALAVDPASDELAAAITRTAAELDDDRPELGSDAARRALVRAHREVAERIDPESATELMLRSAALLQRELDDQRGAFDVLRQGTALLPKSAALHENLLALALKLRRLDAVDAHLSRLINDAIDSDSTVALLERRGKLLEGPLNRFEDAAAVYGKLLQLRPDDQTAAKKLRKSLRRSGRFQDLLLAINKQLQRASDPELRLELLTESARTWERDLKNRWEALDAWRAVLGQDPENARALSAIERLERGRGSTPEVADDDEPFDDAQDETFDAPYEEAPEEDFAAADAGAAGRPSAGADTTDVDEAGEGAEAAAGDAPADSLADLASLDADLSATGGRVEEVDLLESQGVDVDVDVDVDVNPGPPMPIRSGSAPPPPPRSSRLPRVSAVPRVSAPPPVPGKAASGAAPPAGPSTSTSAPPPLPSLRASQGAPARSSAPPPLPPRPRKGN